MPTNILTHLTVRNILTMLIICLTSELISAQEVKEDTTKGKELQEVRVRAFEQNRRLMDVPASVNLVNRNILERYSPGSIVQAVNSTPGVHMEERSPGSYRFNIRGSSLRSPFGVRNVKVYFNDIPITDPGGTTFLNQLGYYNFNSIEIIKGPGSSLYGAGTGGVMLIESMNESMQPGISAEYNTGSYHLQNMYAGLVNATENSTSRLTIQHQENDGYRIQSALKRNVAAWTGLFHVGKEKTLKTSFLYGDLFYETPGALTKAEFDANPRSARPGGGGFPGAVAAHASIHQKTFIAGGSYSQQLSSRWHNNTVAYGMFSELRNPNLRSYDKNSEPHAGARTIFRYALPVSQPIFHLDLGAEWQQGFSSYDSYINHSGKPDTLQTHDEVSNRQSFIFSQASVDHKGWSLLAGASWNFLRVRFERFNPSALGSQHRNFDNRLVPRIALMRRMGKINLYSSISKGFSPPTTAELLPTGGNINAYLQAEKGINYDLGLRGYVLHGLYIDMNGFIYSLENTIVQRRDASGGNYFVNAGSTRQHGVETSINYHLALSKTINTQAWVSHTWHDFHYRHFTQLNNDFSGKRLPGTPEHSLSSGISLETTTGLAFSVHEDYSGKIPLNDMNSAYASAYNLIGVKLSYLFIPLKNYKLQFSAGVDNLLNEKYSLGNDVNGFGGRYYNAAPGRNYYVGVRVEFKR